MSTSSFEVVFGVLVVDLDITVAGAEKDPSAGFFASSDSVVLIVGSHDGLL